MIEIETVLIEAVRDYLREKLQLEDKACEIELDDIAPATTATNYYAISPFGFQNGPTYDSSGTVWDYYLGVRIASMTRLTNVPRDRVRSVYLDRLKGVNARLTPIVQMTDFVYPILDRVNAEIDDELDDTKLGGCIIEPLRFVSIDPKPILIGYEPYDAKPPSGFSGTNENLAIVRGINFGGARYLRVRDNLIPVP